MPKFVPRQRKHKVRERQKSTGASPQNVDTNVIELLPITSAEKEENRRRLREELRAQQPKISNKRQKRLDKYIENKLKKEENLSLLKKLSAAKFDTSQLQSFRHLGISAKERKEKTQKPSGSRIDGNALRGGDYSQDLSEGSDLDIPVTVTAHSGKGNESLPVLSRSPTVGSGLKRPLEFAADGQPVIKKRKRTRKTKVAEEPSWEGFSSDNTPKVYDAHSREADDDAEFDEKRGGGLDTESMARSEDEHSESSVLSSESGERKLIRPRSSAFKLWAVQQIHEAVDFTPAPQLQAGLAPRSAARQLHGSQKSHRAAQAEDDHMTPELQITTGDPNRKAFAVHVERPDYIQTFRSGLPVVAEEQKIMEAIHKNRSVVVWGATGSGKTTQVPQFLFEAGYGDSGSPNPGMIGITQPRRVAAVSMAKRVADELSQFSDRVSYQIRFDSTVSDKTAVKFMTDGVLIREVSQDFALSKYSVIIIDEAHERSVNTDILIGMVSRIVDLRQKMVEENSEVKPLKLIIMSATLRISDFLQNATLFRHGAPPLVQVEGRQYPVTIHFARRTHRDYVNEAFRKISKGHRKLPPGGFLVFLTGQNEIKDLEKRLRQSFKTTRDSAHFHGKVQLSAVEAPLETEDIDLGISVPADMWDEEDSDIEITGLDAEEDDEGFDQEEAMDVKTRMHILPLYSQLPTKEQLKVFEGVPENSRLVVLATNVAETSLTIPGIRYVFDSGRSKERHYDTATGIQSFRIGWISKASASQRAGRAGRTEPGHCYRLYSSAIYESEFQEYTEPEILRTPIEDVVLQMKSMGLHHVINFPFPTPPSRAGISKAEKLLKYLGALSLHGEITDMGRQLSLYPLSPRFSKMLHIGHQHGCMPYVVALVSALSVSEIFIPESQLDFAPVKKEGEDQVYTNADRLEDTARETRRKEYNRAHRIISKYDETSDGLKGLAAVCAYAYADKGETFCSQMFLRQNAMVEASNLRRQLSHLVRSNNPAGIGAYEARLPEPSERQIRALKQILAAGFIDHVAIRADMAPMPPEIPRKPKRAIDMPYLTLFGVNDGKAGAINEIAVYIHPSSVLAHLSPNELPQYLIYSHLQETAASHVTDKVPKIRMFPLTAVSGLQLSALAHGTPLIEYGKPVGKLEPLGGNLERRACWVIPALVGDAGNLGWPLPAKKVIQVKDKKNGWVIERFVK